MEARITDPQFARIEELGQFSHRGPIHLQKRESVAYGRAVHLLPTWPIYASDGLRRLAQGTTVRDRMDAFLAHACENVGYSSSQSPLNVYFVRHSKSSKTQ